MLREQKEARLSLVTDNEPSCEAKAKRNDLIASTISLQNDLLHYISETFKRYDMRWSDY